MIYAKIIEDSITTMGKRITTLELQYHRYIHGELMTHRVFSRNAMSSRAIPVAKMIAQVRNNPAMPVHWGQNQKGMQAGAELLDTTGAVTAWRIAAQRAADDAEGLSAMGLHKQVANRILEPFQWMRTLVTATEWDNFFELRCHPDAQPEFQVLATAIRRAMEDSTPVARPVGHTGDERCWHLPYVSSAERATLLCHLLPKISSARCARVSYLTHDNENPTVENDLALFDRLVGSHPLHASPIEHQALTAGSETVSRNFHGWLQYRELYEDSAWESQQPTKAPDAQ